MAVTDDLTRRALTKDDVAAGAALCDAAGWNQTIDDWRFIVETGSTVGTFAGERLVATAAMMPYGTRVGWIAMVLTDPNFQRRGIARRNLEWAVASCDNSGLVPGLDATEAGRAVYLGLGFEDRFTLTRWSGDISESPIDDSIEIGPFTPSDLTRVAAIDANGLGATRADVLAHIRSSAPDRAWIALDDGALIGFAMTRLGGRSTHVGPIAATDTQVAAALFARCALGSTGAVSVDVPDDKTRFQGELRLLGLSATRTFTRMVRGSILRTVADPTCFAIAGPEFG